MQTRRTISILFMAICMAALHTVDVHAQHTIGVTAGAGFSNARFYPSQETKAIWGKFQAGVSWRYYSALPRFVGCVGADLEWVQCGFSYAPYASIYEDKSDYKYYTRNYNSIMLPIVWQPHFYLIHNRMRVYLELAVTFSYNFGATFENREPYTFGGVTGTDCISGTYHMRIERDNSLSYGLAGGGGFDLLFGQMEFGVRVRYNFGYGDIMRNRNKYYDNGLDQTTNPGENPFWYTPIRSPMDSFFVSLRFGWRFNKEGFKEWSVKRLPKIDKKDRMKFSLD